MVVGDYFSKWIVAYALPMHTVQIVADKLVADFICRHCTASYMHIGQGRKFNLLLNYALY